MKKFKITKDSILDLRNSIDAQKDFVDIYFLTKHIEKQLKQYTYKRDVYLKTSKSFARLFIHKHLRNIYTWKKEKLLQIYTGKNGIYETLEKATKMKDITILDTCIVGVKTLKPVKELQKLPECSFPEFYKLKFAYKYLGK